MADQRLLGWSMCLGVAGLIGLAISKSETPKPATDSTYGTTSTYGSAPAQNYSPPAYSPPSYVYTPPSYQAQPTYTYAPAPTYVYTPPTYLEQPQTTVQQFVPDPVVSEPKSGSAYYKNCAAARAAGAAPLTRSDPGYRAGLDRDGDGIACE